MHTILFSTLVMLQPGDGQPPAKPPVQPPGKDFRNPNVPRVDVPTSPQPPVQVPGQVPGGTTTPGTGPVGTVNVNVEGTWTILAYERNGAPVTGAGRSVVIRGNIMTLQTGDANQPTKNFQLRFLPRNMVVITEIDARMDTTAQTGATTRTRVSAATDPNAVQPRRNGGTQESGVFVLSREFFCISVFENAVVDIRTGVTPGNVNPGNVDTRNAVNPGGNVAAGNQTNPAGNAQTGQGNIIASPPGGPIPGQGAAVNAVLVMRRGS